MNAKCILARQNRNQPPTTVDVSFGLEWGGKIRIDSVELQGREVLRFLGRGFRQEIEDQIQDSLQESEETVQEGWIYHLGEW